MGTGAFLNREVRKDPSKITFEQGLECSKERVMSFLGSRTLWAKGVGYEIISFC